MEYYINYILDLLSKSQMDEQTLISNLEKKFTLTDSYCADILSDMVEQKLIVSEFNDDFHNIYTITNLGLDKINNSMSFDDEDQAKNDNIDYKTLLGDMYNNEENDDEQDEIVPNTLAVTDDIKTTELEDILSETKDEEKQKGKEDVYLKDFSRYKINVKKHVKSARYHAETKEYLRSSSLELFTAIILFAFYCLLEGISYLILASGDNVSYQINLTFIIYTCICALYPIAFLIYYLVHPTRKDANKFNFWQLFKLILLCVGIAILLVLSLNFLFGLNKLNVLKFLASWLFPILIGIALIMYPVIKLILIKTNKFNA